MLTAVALVALFSAGLTLVLRATVAKAATFRGTKPWACDLCMSWWGAILGALLAVACGELDAHGDFPPFAARLALVVLGSVPVSMLVLRRVGQPGSAPDFGLPPDDEA